MEVVFFKSLVPNNNNNNNNIMTGIKVSLRSTFLI